MSLRETLNAEIKNAMLAKNKERLGALRLLLSEVKKKEVDERITLNDEQMITIASKMIKERKDSVNQYTQANRLDLAQAEEFEISVLFEFLPAQLSEDELNKIINDTIAETGAAGPKDMGKVMSAIKPKVQGKTDMGSLSSKIKEILNK